MFGGIMHARCIKHSTYGVLVLFADRLQVSGCRCRRCSCAIRDSLIALVCCRCKTLFFLFIYKQDFVFVLFFWFFASAHHARDALQFRACVGQVRFREKRRDKSAAINLLLLQYNVCVLSSVRFCVRHLHLSE